MARGRVAASKLSTQSSDQIGSTGTKSFVDNTVPAGSTMAGDATSFGSEPVNIVFGARLPQAA